MAAVSNTAVSSSFVVGVDGCHCGWLAIRLFRNHSWETCTFGSIEELWKTWRQARLILIDIPIGLPDKNRPVRHCDVVARHLLGKPRASGVFPAPTRAALAGESYAEASRLNKIEIGQGVSKQSFSIMKKICEVDDLLHDQAAARRIIKEVHPEVCFWAFNHRRAMRHRKKRTEGFEERLKLLCRTFPRSQVIVHGALVRYRRKDVERDDILDALVAAVTAMNSNAITGIPTVRQCDRLGLPMEIVYCDSVG